MKNYFFVFVGGGVGASARYWLSGSVYRWLGRSDFPYGTLTVNIVGCLVIGLLMSAMEDRFLVSPSLRIFLTIGILGGFTTFSTFSFETVALLRDTQFTEAFVNIALSLATCLGATYAGTILGRLI